MMSTKEMSFHGTLKHYIQTRSALKILAPISNKMARPDQANAEVDRISKLLLIHESYRINKDDSQIPMDLGAQAEYLTSTIKELILVALKFSHYASEESKEKMGVACGLLENMVKNVSLASHKLAMEPFQMKYHSLYASSCKELIDSIYRVMAAIEEVDVDKMEKAALWVKDRLSILISCRDANTLVPIFKQYTEALLILLNFVAKRQRDMWNQHQKQALGMSAIVLKKVAPMINKSIQMTLKYPSNSQAKSTLRQVEGDILQAVQDVMDIVKNDQWPESSSDGGTFVSLMDQLLEVLKSGENREIALLENDFESLVDRIVTHSIAVSRLSKSEERRLVVINSQKVLECTCKLAAIAGNLQTHPTMQQLRQDMDDLIDELISELHDLERHVNSLLVYQVIDCFKQTSEPLDRLIKSATLSQISAIPDEHPASVEFSNHADMVYQVATYVADSSSDAISVARIRASVAALAKLDREILPGLASFSQNSTDPSNFERLKLLKSRWGREITKLRDMIDSISDSVIYVEVTETQVKTHLEESKIFLESRNSDIAEFACHIQSITLLCKHLLIVLNQHPLDDFHVQERLKASCNKFKSVMNGVRSISNRIAAELNNVSLREIFWKRTDLLLSSFSYLRSLLNSDSDVESLEPDPEGAEDFTPHDHNSDSHDEHSLVKPVSDGATKWLSLETPEFSKSWVSGAYHDYSYDILDLTISKIGSPDQAEVELDLDQLVNSLFEAALTRSLNMDVHCSNLLKRTNFILDIAKKLMPYTSAQAQKVSMQELVSSLTKLAMDIPLTATTVSTRDVGDKDKLKALLTQWVRAVEMLHRHIDAQLAELGKISLDVVNARELENSTMLSSAIEQLNCIQSQYEKICGEIKKYNIDILQAASNSGNMKELVKHLTHTSTSTGIMGVLQRNTARQWSTILYTTIKHCEETTQQKLRDLNHGDTNPQTASFIISTMEAVKKMVKAVGLIGASANESCTDNIVQLQEVFDQWTHFASTPSTENETTLTSLHESVIILAWSAKLVTGYRAIDEAIENHCRNLYALAFAAFEVLTSSGHLKTSNISHYILLNNDIQANLKEVLVVLDKLTNSNNRSQIAELKSTLGKYMDTYFNACDKLKERTSDVLLSSYKSAQRQLVCLLLEVRDAIRAIPNHQIHIAQECEQYLIKLIGDSSTPSYADQSHLISTSLPSKSSTASEALLNQIRTPSKMSIVQSIPSASNPRSRTPALSTAVCEPSKPTSPTKTSALRKLFSESPFKAAINRYQVDLDHWLDENNPVVSASRQIARCLAGMGHYVTNRDGPIDSGHDLFSMSHDVVKLSKEIIKFTVIIAKYSLADWRVSEELMYHSNQIPFYAQQLHLLTCVKQTTEKYDLTVRDLIKVTDNLMKSIIQSLEKTEAICLKGLKEPPQDSSEEQQVFRLATRWRASLDNHRQREAQYSNVNDLGLRVISRNIPGPRISQMCEN